MSQNFQRGDLVPVQWQATGGVAGTLNIKGHSLDLSALLYDVTNTGSGGVRARIAGPLDIDGTIQASFDLDIPFYGVPAIFPGFKGICAFGMNAAQTKFLQTPVIIEKVSPTVAIENELRYSFTVKGNALAGFIVLPPL